MQNNTVDTCCSYPPLCHMHRPTSHQLAAPQACAHDGEGQVTVLLPTGNKEKKLALLEIINTLFKVYFQLNTLRLCKTLINAVASKQFLEFGMFPASQRVTYRYFTGRLNIFDEKYVSLRSCLPWAPCPDSSTRPLSWAFCSLGLKRALQNVFTGRLSLIREVPTAVAVPDNALASTRGFPCAMESAGWIRSRDRPPARPQFPALAYVMQTIEPQPLGL